MAGAKATEDVPKTLSTKKLQQQYHEWHETAIYGSNSVATLTFPSRPLKKEHKAGR